MAASVLSYTNCKLQYLPYFLLNLHIGDGFLKLNTLTLSALFLKWPLPALSLDMSIAANEGASQKQQQKKKKKKKKKWQTK